MRVFVAGATGVIGLPMVRFLVDAGHTVAGMTRTPSKAQLIGDLGARAVVCDVYDADELRTAIVEFAPDVVVNQLTDLPDDAGEIPAKAAANARMRREGNRNVLSAADAANAQRVVVQSIAWEVPGEVGLATKELEQDTLAAGGVVVRYGQFYGPGTYHEAPPDPPRIEVTEAARRTVELLDAPSGIVEIVED
ncbi:MAG TPA: NAD(P)H-binding protein [Acidothermaceae bacterium]